MPHTNEHAGVYHPARFYRVSGLVEASPLGCTCECAQRQALTHNGKDYVPITVTQDMTGHEPGNLPTQRNSSLTSKIPSTPGLQDQTPGECTR